MIGITSETYKRVIQTIKAHIIIYLWKKNDSKKTKWILT